VQIVAVIKFCRADSRRDVESKIVVAPLRGSGFCSQSFLCFDHGFNTVVHVLHEIFLGATETSLVGDVVGAVVRLRVLTMDTTDLDVVLVSDGLELFLLLAELGELDVDRGAESSAKVGWAGSDVAQVAVVGELRDLFNGSGCA